MSYRIEYRWVDILLAFDGAKPTFYVAAPVNASYRTTAEVRAAIDAAFN